MPLGTETNMFSSRPSEYPPPLGYILLRHVTKKQENDEKRRKMSRETPKTGTIHSTSKPVSKPHVMQGNVEIRPKTSRKMPQKANEQCNYYCVRKTKTKLSGGKIRNKCRRMPTNSSTIYLLFRLRPRHLPQHGFVAGGRARAKLAVHGQDGLKLAALHDTQLRHQLELDQLVLGGDKVLDGLAVEHDRPMVGVLHALNLAGHFLFRSFAEEGRHGRAK